MYLVGQAQTEEAINKIIKWATENQRKKLENEAILLMGRLNGLNREKRIGILPNNEAQIRQNRINVSILASLDSLEDASQDEITDDFSSEKIKILMLTANPATTTKLNLDREYAVINQKLQQKSEFFNIILKKAVSGSEFQEFTQEEQPNILHFSGHGEEGKKYAGLVVQNEDKNDAYLIKISGLKALFKFFKNYFTIDLVLLNACHAQEQAAAIAEYVDYVIGTNVAIGDTAASAFSSGFYFQLAHSNPMNIEHAFHSGRTQAIVKGAAEENFVIYRHGKLIEI